MDLPAYVYFVFGITVFSAIFIFYKATRYSRLFLAVALIWLIFQSAVSLSGFYRISNTIPPRFGLLIIPPLILIVIAFNTKKGKYFIDGLDIHTLTLFHSIRIPVEMALYWLFIHKAVPGLMTFEGRNFDILSGLSAPVVYYFAFRRKIFGRKVLLAWNFICLLLLFNIVFFAVLSLPSSFQQFAFEQPNLALLQFPFVFLPSIVVPLVLFAHLAAIRRLWYNIEGRLDAKRGI